MRVVVADDQTVVREGLVTLLGTMPGIEVVGPQPTARRRSHWSLTSHPRLC